MSETCFKTSFEEKGAGKKKKPTQPSIAPIIISKFSLFFDNWNSVTSWNTLYLIESSPTNKANEWTESIFLDFYEWNRWPVSTWFLVMFLIAPSPCPNAYILRLNVIVVPDKRVNVLYTNKQWRNKSKRIALLVISFVCTELLCPIVGDVISLTFEWSFYFSLCVSTNAASAGGAGHYSCFHSLPTFIDDSFIAGRKWKSK